MLTSEMQKHLNNVSWHRKPTSCFSLEQFPSIINSSNLEFLENSTKTLEKVQKPEYHKENDGKFKVPVKKKNYSTSGPNFCLIPMCCRTYFFDLERILPAEDKKVQYKSYKYPFSPASIETLKKTICAFLNTIGGQIYIGVKQTTNKKYRYILGNYLTENDKEEIVKVFRKISECISPNCTESLETEFVPIRRNPFPELDLKEQSECYLYDFSKKPLDLRKCSYLPARYVIRIRVPPGNKNSIYSYVQTEYQLNKNATSNEFIPFRSQNQVLVKEISQQILKLFRFRLIHEKERLLAKVHEGPCHRPEMGSPRNEPEAIQSAVDVKKIEAVLNDNWEKGSKIVQSSSSKSKQSAHRDELGKSKEKNSQNKKATKYTSQAQLKLIFKHPLSFIVLNMTVQRLTKCIAKTPANQYALIEKFKDVFNIESQILIISINGYHHMQQFLRVIKSIENHFSKENVEFIGISKCIKADDPQARKIMETRLENMEQQKHVMRKRVIEFYSLGVAASYLLYMRELGYHLEAVQE